MFQNSIAINSLFNMLYKGFTALFPLLTITFISRTLQPEKLGLVAYANTVVLYFVALASLGIPSYGVKEISKCGEDIYERSKKFYELFCINFISTFFYIFIYYLIVNLIPYFQYQKDILNVMGVILILNLFNVDWFYQGIEEYKIIAIRGIIVKIVSFILMILLISGPSDYLKYAFILCMATAGNYIFNILIIRKYVIFKFVKLDIKCHLKPIFILLASTIATEFYLALDTVMLEYYHGSSHVAYYTNATKVVRMIYTLVIAFVMAFYPRITYYIQNNKQNKSNELVNIGFKIILLIALPCTFGLIVSARYIVLILFGEQYENSISVIKIASVLIPVFSLAYFLGHIILIATGNEKYILKATFCGAIVNSVFNFCLIPNYAENGAIISSVISEITVSLVLIYHSKNYFIIKPDYNFYKSLFLSILSMLIVNLLINYLFNTTSYLILQILSIVFVSALVYFSVTVLTKNQIIFMLKEKLTNRLLK